MTQIQNQKRSVNVMGSNNSMNMNPLFRSESFGNYYYYNYNYYPYPDQQNYTMMEKRQLFLRSYQFHRKKGLAERIKGSLVRVKKVVCLRLRSATRLRRLVLFRIKCGFRYRRRWFSRLLNAHKYCKCHSSSSCFC